MRMLDAHPVYPNIKICQDLTVYARQCHNPREPNSYCCRQHNQQRERERIKAKQRRLNAEVINSAA